MYEVEWSERAIADLGRIWAGTPIMHPHLLAARAVLDHHLRHDPYRLSESRETDARRIQFAYPLGILFDVFPEEKRIVILTAWFYTLPS